MFLAQFILDYWWVWITIAILSTFVSKTVFGEFDPLPWQIAKKTEPIKTLGCYLVFVLMVLSLTLWLAAALINLLE